MLPNSHNETEAIVLYMDNTTVGQDGSWSPTEWVTLKENLLYFMLRSEFAQGEKQRYTALYGI